MRKQIVMSCLLTLLIYAGRAQERGIPLFSDSFDTKDTFAENWVPKAKWIKSENGAVHFSGTGSLTMRRDTPREFYSEMDISLDITGFESKAKSGQAFCGLMIDGYRFMILPSGKTWMIYKLNSDERALGKQMKINGFAQKKPMKLTLIRKAENDVATYIFRVNGNDAGSFVVPAPVALPGVDGKPQPFKPLEIFTYNLNMTLDNFSISAIKRSDKDSPNLIINSGFEHVLDGFPPYYSTPAFNPATITRIPYEEFLASVSLDSKEKHSGNYSLKLVNDGRTRSGRQAIRPWGVGTVKDTPGVFSLWMKSDQDDLPVSIAYGSKPEVVKVGKEWKRYKVVNHKLPKPGIYSPVYLSFRKQGTLWIDDLQAEFASPPPDDELSLQEISATPYKPSELDKSRFGKKQETVSLRAPEIVVPKLPPDAKPEAALENWIGDATKVNTFYNGEKIPKTKTDAYLACDDKTLYVGFRCYVDDLAKVSPKGDMVEILAEPIVSGKKFMQFQFFIYSDGTRTDKGLGMDSSWDGNWKGTVKKNEETSSLDYLFSIPFTDFSHPGMKTRWIMNLHRYDSASKEVVTLIRSANPSFANPQLWPFVKFPEQVIKPYIIGVAGGGYSDSSVTLDLVNHTGKQREVSVNLTAGGATKKKDVMLKQGANSVSFPIQLKSPKVMVRLQENGKPLCSQNCILEKRDPITMLGRLSFYMNEKEAPFRVKTSVASPEKLTAVLSCGNVSVKQKGAAKFRIALPLKDITDGTHDVVLKMVDANRKTVAQAKTTLIKRPFRKGAGQINHFSRSLMHDGKPVVPFAPFMVIYGKWGMKKEALDNYIALLKKYGFRFVHILFQSEKNTDKENALVQHFLDTANKNGIKVILWSKYYAYTDEACAKTRKLLDFPNVITQMVLDEPELGMASEDALKYLRKMRAFFPYHPTQMNNTVLGIPNRYANLETDILMLDDYLTNTENRSVSSVVQQADIMWKAGAADGKPCWYFLACNNTPLHYREPTYDEQIAQTYGCVANGCTGFSYFYGWPGTPGNWKAYLQLNKELLALTDVLTSEEETAQSSATGNPKLMLQLTKKHNGYMYIIACNTDEKPAGSVDFTLPPAFRYVDEAEVLFENRKVKVREGKFTDNVPAHARHVYKVKIQ